MVTEAKDTSTIRADEVVVLSHNDGFKGQQEFSLPDKSTFNFTPEQMTKINIQRIGTSSFSINLDNQENLRPRYSANGDEDSVRELYSMLRNGGLPVVFTAENAHQLIKDADSLIKLMKKQSAKYKEFILQQSEICISIDKTKTESEKLAEYILVRHGSSILFYNRKEKHILAACFNPYDRTFFIIDPRAEELAALFGTKRFLVGPARSNSDIAAIKHPRDLSCPLVSPKEEKTVKGYTLEQVLDLHKANLHKFYQQMSVLYNQCADFTRGKQEEYSAEDMVDKFCRLNLENYDAISGVVTDHILLLDENLPGKVLGTVSATIIVNPDTLVDVYFYDEIVDYLAKLKPTELAELKTLQAKDSLSDDDKKRMAEIVDTKRMELMSLLFAAARKQVCATIRKLLPSMPDNEFEQKMKQAHGFIRAAEGRVPLYVLHLHCSATNTENHVIHGDKTKFAEYLDLRVKEWAQEKLNEMTPALIVNPARTTSGMYVEPKAVSAEITTAPQKQNGMPSPTFK